MSKSNRQRYMLRSQERLKLRKQIETLFSKGEAFSVFPIRVIWLLAEGSKISIKVGFSVSKKKMKLAVDRNRTKRLLREAWRTNKHPLIQQIEADKSLHCFFIYIDNKQPVFSEINKTMLQVIEKLSHRCNP